MTAVIGLDIGTTSTIGILVGLPNTILATASRPVTLSSPHAGWAEENPADWWANARAIISELLEVSGISASAVSAIGVTGMLPAVVLLDKEGAVLRPSIQQSDGRCGAEVEALRAEWNEDDFLARAGNGINQQLVTAKLRWIEKHEPEVFSRIATVFGSYDYINYRLTGTQAVEQNWALEAGFVNVATDAIDEELVRLAHIESATIPPKRASSDIMGHVDERGSSETGLAIGTPVVGGAADMIASALGAGVIDAGDVLLKFGGAVDILTATDVVKPDPRLFLDYHLVPGLYMPNGCMSTGGSALNWFVDTFARGEQAAALAAGRTIHQHLDALAAKKPAGADGLTILPYMLGEKTPIHDPAARGVIEGLTLSHDIGHLWRALLESYAYAIRHHIEVLVDMGHEPKRFLVSDGGSHSTVWMQIVADVLNAPLQRLSGHPGSCIGAAWAAAIGVGLESDWRSVTRFTTFSDMLEPQAQNVRIYDAGYDRYRDLYQRLAPKWKTS
ncbi:carbohydrate kinase [Rhizobium sp. AC44/96]|uniref:FGGY-family carbohydrate kinase n=1 Tax=unclassified Rhizobium TaxID=2613769 RepID=UPI00080FAF49|nr:MULTISPECIES: FGGY-family carbohydrate kinase [unclassified Rhizobium]MDM9622885.1 FGGY-family carbohydrate kinase [Rhizobium sp. S96]OCJ13219.1 carbohydrate kinase [Rhizobium sp. AC44/96]